MGAKSSLMEVFNILAIIDCVNVDPSAGSIRSLSGQWKGVVELSQVLLQGRQLCKRM